MAIHASLDISRRPCREISLGRVRIGGAAPVSVQSMTNTDTRDVEATVSQIKDLLAAGCDIVRLAVLDEPAAVALKTIVAHPDLEKAALVADIHFDSRLAVLALEAGVHGLRINPGNIGGQAEVDRVVDAARAAGTPIRIGVNSGSVQKDILARHGGPTPAAMVESALTHAAMLEKRGFYDTKISIKSSSVPDTLAAYRLLAARCDYPLHLGVTEAGSLLRGTVKSALGIGMLLAEGIGDTIRVSLTEEPRVEVRAAFEILRALGLGARGPNIISCPTCGRCRLDLIGLVREVEAALAGCDQVFDVAVMGCEVNGPGEAAEADVGLACGPDSGIIFARGKVLGKVRGRDNLVPALKRQIDVLLHNKGEDR